jgi:hypothetical protein
MAKVAKKFVKNGQKMEKNPKKFAEKNQKFLTHFTRGGSPPPENILFLTLRKSIKVYLWSQLLKKSILF